MDSALDIRPRLDVGSGNLFALLAPSWFVCVGFGWLHGLRCAQCAMVEQSARAFRRRMSELTRQGMLCLKLANFWHWPFRVNTRCAVTGIYSVCDVDCHLVCLAGVGRWCR